MIFILLKVFMIVFEKSSMLVVIQIVKIIMIVMIIFKKHGIITNIIFQIIIIIIITVKVIQIIVMLLMVIFIFVIFQSFAIGDIDISIGQTFFFLNRFDGVHEFRLFIFGQIHVFKVLHRGGDIVFCTNSHGTKAHGHGQRHYLLVEKHSVLVFGKGRIMCVCL